MLYAIVKNTSADVLDIFVHAEFAVVIWALSTWCVLFICDHVKTFVTRRCPAELFVFVIGALCALVTRWFVNSLETEVTLQWVFVFAGGAVTLIFSQVEGLLLVSRNIDLLNAQISVLQERIRPHFLFNTLNNVLGLIRRDPVHAEVILEKLALLFREVVQDNRMVVPFSHERYIAQAYLDIEAVRVGPRFSCIWSVADIVEEDDPQVPALLLQPLFENAIRYGVESTDLECTIAITVVKQSGMLVLEMQNAYNETTSAGSGIALQNLRDRLAWLYDSEGGLEVVPHLSSWKVIVRFPYTVLV